MPRMIFINLAVKDVAKAADFYVAVGFKLNPEFSGTDSACIVISDTIHVMLGSHETFMRFSPKPICDTSQSLEVLNTLSCDSREEVDDFVRRARAAGGTSSPEAEDSGWMYQHDFLDLDGHAWGLFSMDMSQMPSGEE